MPCLFRLLRNSVGRSLEQLPACLRATPTARTAKAGSCRWLDACGAGMHVRANLPDWPAHRRARNSPASLRSRRSEEHTSELQSLAYLVCRLLLEKKKKQKEPTSSRKQAQRQPARGSQGSEV